MNTSTIDKADLDIENLLSVTKLKVDERRAAINLGDDQVRFLVDAYYQMQHDRIRAAGQVRAMTASDEPHSVLEWLGDQSSMLENQIKGALDLYSKNHKIGAWMRSIKGIGPVISAGLLAHIDIKQAPTAGYIWSFAGQVPGVKWEKGQKRPWNAKLKTLCWKLGESFVKTSNYEDAFYGKIYQERKVLEIANNDALKFADQAANILATKKISKDTDAYKAYIQGKLPPAHVHARARRYAVKLFLSHLHHVWYVAEYNKLPPKPYAIEHMGHAHMLEVPNFDIQMER